MILLLIAVPVVAARFSIALALRLDDAGLKGIGTRTIGWVPPFAFFWTFAGPAAVDSLGLPLAVFLSLILACYASVLVALTYTLRHRTLWGHVVWVSS
jgi:hypothetical protein